MQKKTIKQRETSGAIFHATEINEVMRRIYAGRGIDDPQALQHTVDGMYSYQSLSQIQCATELLYTALQQQWRVVIVGDFDADGATSTAVAVQALRLMGAHYVGYCLPNRVVDGYGLSVALMPALAKHNPDLLITVDNGVSSIEGVEAARSQGWRVLITDHHLPGEQLPKADAMVNPNAKGDAFPSKSLAGVGVIFYVLCALRRYAIDQGWFQRNAIAVPNMAQFLDLVALGTVADVVPLDYNNRIMVQQGLQRMRSGVVRPGIKALIEVAGKDFRFLSAADLGFSVAPRLNAAGRLEDMSIGVACLLAETAEDAMPMAMRLDQLNRDRRVIEGTMRQEASAIVDALSTTQAIPAAICLYHNDWHQGVIGLVASRLKEQHACPVIVFASDGVDQLKGSGRSIPGINLRDVIAQINSQFPGIIIKFGGHAMAAGLTIDKSKLTDFKQHLVDVVEVLLSQLSVPNELLTDGMLAVDELSLPIAKLIEAGGPWGQQFEMPCFHGDFMLLSQRIVGENHLKCTLGMVGTDQIFDAILFQADLTIWPNRRCGQVRCVYVLDINRYRDMVRLQLIIQWMEPLKLVEDALA